MNTQERLNYFMQKNGRRYWWFDVNHYLPDFYAMLDNDEFGLVQAFFDETDEKTLIGEWNVPFMSLLQGLIMGNGIGKVVQLGHYAGWSSLILGFIFKHMGKKNALFSLDILTDITVYARKWIDLANLNEIAKLQVGNSASPEDAEDALKYLGNSIDMVIIDSSHQYEHTLRELVLWYPLLRPGGFVIMHDAGKDAQVYDTTRQGGVFRAIGDWTTRYGYSSEIMIINRDNRSNVVYLDGCGAAIIQKGLEE